MHQGQQGKTVRTIVLQWDSRRVTVRESIKHISISCCSAFSSLRENVDFQMSRIVQPPRTTFIAFHLPSLSQKLLSSFCSNHIHLDIHSNYVIWKLLPKMSVTAIFHITHSLLKIHTRRNKMEEQQKMNGPRESVIVLSFQEAHRSPSSLPLVFRFFENGSQWTSVTILILPKIKVCKGIWKWRQRGAKHFPLLFPFAR